MVCHSFWLVNLIGLNMPRMRTESQRGIGLYRSRPMALSHALSHMGPEGFLQIIDLTDCFEGPACDQELRRQTHGGDLRRLRDSRSATADPEACPRQANCNRRGQATGRSAYPS